jgi:hypothetical protein
MQNVESELPGAASVVQLWAAAEIEKEVVEGGHWRPGRTDPAECLFRDRPRWERIVAGRRSLNAVPLLAGIVNTAISANLPASLPARTASVGWCRLPEIGSLPALNAHTQ